MGRPARRATGASEKSNLNWKAVDAAMVQAAALAEKVAAFRHPKLSAVRLAGELNKSPTDGATLDELLERIKTHGWRSGHEPATLCCPCGGPSADRGAWAARAGRLALQPHVGCEFPLVPESE